MPSLADRLLGLDDPRPSRPQYPNHYPPAPRAAAPPSDFSRSYPVRAERAPAPRRPTGSWPAGRSFRAALRESVASRDSLVLTPAEARMVLRMMEDADQDPFVYRDGAFTTDDLEGVGLPTAGHAGHQGRPRPVRSAGQAPGALDEPAGPADILSPSLALTAPDATPDEDEEPPPDIAGDLQAFADGPEDDGLAPSPYSDDEVQAMIRGGSDEDDGDDGLGGFGGQTQDQFQSGEDDNGFPPPRPQRRQESAHPPAGPPDVESAGFQFEVLNAMRRAKAKELKERESRARRRA